LIGFPTDAEDALTIPLFLSILDIYGTYFIFNINTLPSLGDCRVLMALLERDGRNPPRGLIMFPGSALDADLMDSCIRPLKALGYDTGIAPPVELTTACAQSLPQESVGNDSCVQLRAFLRRAEQSGGFSDLGIRAEHAHLVEWGGDDVRLGWNGIDFPVEALGSLRDSVFLRVSIDSPHDPNN
jgi:hypothetical protein